MSFRVHAVRLRPGQDLKAELFRFAHEHRIRAGFIVTCVGSLRCAALRMANQQETTMLEDKFEIVSLVGTLEIDGGHLHISLSRGDGSMIGGHLQEGSLIYTTAEVVIGEAPDMVFTREFDPDSGYPELVIR